MRYLAIDLGDQRTGVALGDSDTRIATPTAVVEIPIARRGGNELLASLVAVVERELGAPRAPGELVLGLPLNMDGTEGPRAKAVRGFGQRLADATGRTVRLADERLSTVAADEAMARTGLTRGQKKARRDAIAAAAILRAFLEESAEVGEPILPVGGLPGNEPPEQPCRAND